MTIKITGPVQLFNNGMCMVFHRGEQVGELQKSFVEMWCENAAGHGYDPDGLEIQTPGGKYQIFKIEDGWNFKRV